MADRDEESGTPCFYVKICTRWSGEPRLKKMLASPFVRIGTVHTQLNAIQNSTKAQFVCIFETHVQTSSMFYSKVKRKSSFWSLPFQFSILWRTMWRKCKYSQHLAIQSFSIQLNDFGHPFWHASVQVPEHWDGNVLQLKYHSSLEIMKGFMALSIHFSLDIGPTMLNDV